MQRSSLILAATVLALTACNAHGMGTSSALPATAGAGDSMNASGDSKLYVANGSYSAGSKPKTVSISLFDADSTSANAKPIGATTVGKAGAYGMAFDKHGNLFVTNIGGAVMGFKTGAKKPFITLTKGVVNPYAVYVGKDDTVYVTDFVGFGTGPGSVEVFPAGHTIASYTYTDRSFWNVTGVVVDAKKTLYIGYTTQSSNSANAAYTADVDEVTAGSTKLKHLNLSIYPGANVLMQGLTIDGKGNLVVAVANQTAAGSYILVFPPGATQPSRTFGPFNAYVGQLAFSKDYSRLFVAVNGTGAYALDYASGALVTTFRTKDASFTNAVAVWPGAQP
jgi:sugar lactone lactonase YvrE